MPSAVRRLSIRPWPGWVGVVLMLLFVHAGCGIKGPPVPGRQLPVPAVKDLAYRIDNQTVTLSWQLALSLTSKQAGNAVFRVYRSLNALTDATCVDCPVVFEKVDEVPYTDVQSGVFSIDLPLKSGNRYRFKVRLETAGSVGVDSNTVGFDHPLSDQGETP